MKTEQGRCPAVRSLVSMGFHGFPSRSEWAVYRKLENIKRLALQIRQLRPGEGPAACSASPSALQGRLPSLWGLPLKNGKYLTSKKKTSFFLTQNGLLQAPEQSFNPDGSEEPGSLSLPLSLFSRHG